MQRPIILLITDDPQFESTATDAILESHRGARRVTCLPDAMRALAQPAQDIALAVVDLDIDRREGALRALLEGQITNFPILAVANDPDLFFYDKDLQTLVADYLIKPVAFEELWQKITALCAEGDYESSLHLVHL